MYKFAIWILAILLLPMLGPAAALASESLESNELAQLRRYLDELKSGAVGRGESVDQLAEISFAGLIETIEAYVALDEPVEPQTQRAFQALLERISRSANLPWPLLKMYSPDLADFLTRPEGENRLAQRLFDRLIRCDERRSSDLAVRLTSEATLRHLAAGKPKGRLALLAAWNRHLGLGTERRPIPELDRLVAKIAQQFAVDRELDECAALLLFMAQSPAESAHYNDCLTKCLESDSPKLVLLGLAVQERVPARLELNAAVIGRFSDNPAVVRAALRNYAFDADHDYSETLRRLWSQLKPGDDPARVACLFSMGVHARGNDKIALAAVLDQPFAFIDVALPVLKAGNRDLARQAVEHILSSSARSNEEALRLASALELEGFEKAALRIAQDADKDGALRHTAVLYLRLAEGKTRRQLLPFLTHANADLRLAAIQAFGAARGLTPEDKEAIGPALIRVAQSDSSMGHRQEAIYSIGNWREPLARDFFHAVLTANPPTEMRRGYYADDDKYWQYRFRLVALLGLVKLSDAAAREELLELHRRGGPAERMDVLLALLDLGEMSPITFEDLNWPEPKLVATAANLIAGHGDAADRARLRQYFHHTPLWLQFKNSGIDDNNLLHTADSLEGKRETP